MGLLGGRHLLCKFIAQRLATGNQNDSASTQGSKYSESLLTSKYKAPTSTPC